MAGTSSHVSAGVWLLRATRPPWLRRITWNHLENHFTIQTLTLKKRSFKSHLLSACFHSQCFWAAQPGPSPFQTNQMVSLFGPCSGWCGQQGASASRDRIWGPGGRRSAPRVQVRWNAPTRPGSPRWQVVPSGNLT